MKKYLVSSTTKNKVNLEVRGSVSETVYEVTAETCISVEANSTLEVMTLYSNNECEGDGETFYPILDEEIVLPDARIHQVLEEGEILEVHIELSAESA